MYNFNYTKKQYTKNGKEEFDYASWENNQWCIIFLELVLVQ